MQGLTEGLGEILGKITSSVQRMVEDLWSVDGRYMRIHDATGPNFVMKDGYLVSVTLDKQVTLEFAMSTRPRKDVGINIYRNQAEEVTVYQYVYNYTEGKTWDQVRAFVSEGGNLVAYKGKVNADLVPEGQGVLFLGLDKKLEDAFRPLGQMVIEAQQSGRRVDLSSPPQRQPAA